MSFKTTTLFRSKPGFGLGDLLKVLIERGWDSRWDHNRISHYHHGKSVIDGPSASKVDDEPDTKWITTFTSDRPTAEIRRLAVELGFTAERHQRWNYK